MEVIKEKSLKLVENNNREGNKRLEYIDIARGISILLMIVGHVIARGLKMNIIYSFHMPIFVIISGMFFKERSLLETIKNITLKLILPYIICTLITDFIVYRNEPILEIISIWGKQILFSYCMWGSLPIPERTISIGALWFLPFLALTKLIFVILKKATKKDEYLMFFSVLLVVYIGYILGIKGYWLPFSLDISMVSIIFFYIGYYLKKENILNIVLENWKILLICFIIWIIGIKYNAIELAIRNYNDLLFSTLTAICGSIIIFKLSYYIEKFIKFLINILTWYGKNSMYVVLFHYLEQNIINYQNIFYNIGIDNLLENIKILKFFTISSKIIVITLCILAMNMLKILLTKIKYLIRI